MEDFDDDFGDLYAGVEAQANSAMNGAPDFAHFYTEPEEDVSEDNGKAKTTSPGTDSDCEELGEKVSALEENEDYSGSDSEDDLKIVLNDEDCEGKVFPNGGRGRVKNDEHEDEDSDGFPATKEYKYIRTQGPTSLSNGKGSEAVGSASSMSVRGDHENSLCYQRKGLSSQISCIGDTPNQMVPQNRYGFRLPWYRTILDVNIESFEEKPWRYPEVDVTDYFNFGLKEDSWKQYCISLEQLRLTSMQFRIPVSRASKLYQAKEAGSEYDKFAQETIYKETNNAGPRKFAPPSRDSDSSFRELELPKGRAIQIEDSMVERQPSFDGRHPRSLDSDVVIQIAVQDGTEETTNSGEEQGHTNCTAHEASENVECNANGNRTIPAKEDDLSVGTPEGNTRIADSCSRRISATHPMTIDSDQRNDQYVDLDGYDYRQGNAVSLETTEITNKTKDNVGGDTLYVDQCMMEAQLSLGDDDQLSPTSFESDYEASKNSVHFDPEDINTPATSSFKNPKSNGIKRKIVDIKDYSMHKSPARKEHKHQQRRLDSVVEPKIHINDDASPTSEMDDLYDRDSSLNSSRRKKILPDFGCSDGEDISDYKESRHYGRRHADNHVHTAKTNYLDRKGSHNIQDKVGPFFRKNWNEREYFCEDRDTDWHRFGRTQFPNERSLLPSRESRGWHSKYSPPTVKERDAQFKRNANKLQFKKIPNHGGGCFGYKHEDDFVGEKFGRRASFTDRKRNTLDEFDEWQFPRLRRDLGGRDGYVDKPVFDWDDSWSGKIEDEYCRHGENQYLSDQLYRDLHAGEGRWNDSLSPRNDVSYSRTAERYGRREREIYSAESKESNWFDNRYDADEIDDIIYPSDQFKWRRSNWRSSVLHWTEDQLTVRHHGDKLYSERSSRSYQKYSSVRSYKRGTLIHNGRQENMDPEIGGEQTTLADSSESRTVQFNTRKVGHNQNNAKGLDKFPVTAQNGDMDVEEGQIVTDGLNTAHLQRRHASEYSAAASKVKRRTFAGESGSSGNKVAEGYDNQRILETKAKMEKRGERFKEPIILKKEPDKLSKPEIDLVVETAEAQLHRPSRKRRWGGIEVV
ncbi:FIP1[III]-like protein isoform X2 [Malus domestica]|uniref:FIP1[III]-like protein isoform X2 n=1 Tax=Malus domestica TaxID=3750 RepID=UPI0007ED15F4|nr:FIP1[V]-like protein isoform X3 [Malus domestica]